MPNPVTPDGSDPRVFAVALCFETYAASEEEAQAEAQALADRHQQITHTGYAVAVGAPGDSDASAGSAFVELGGLVLRYVPEGVDLELLLECLGNSTVKETVETVVDAIGTDDGEESGEADKP
jgi:hypothetical protein